MMVCCAFELTITFLGGVDGGGGWDEMKSDCDLLNILFVTKIHDCDPQIVSLRL